MKLKGTIRGLSGHTLIYSLTWLASSATSILLLPIYTRYLSRADYGILELLDYTNVIISIIVLAGLNLAIPRFFNEANDPLGRRQTLSSATIFVLVSGFLCVLIGFMFSVEIADLILGETGHENLINLNIILLYAQLVGNISGVTFIAEKKSKVFLFYTIVRLVLCIGANLYFIVLMGLGVVGMLYGNIFGNTLVAVAILTHNVVRNGLSVSLPVLKKMIRFGIPLIPASILGTIMHNADRFLIRYYCTLDEVGLYCIGYKFPFMLNALIMQSFSLIWTGAVIYEISKEPDAAYQYGRITTYVIGLFLLAQLCLFVFAPLMIRILVDQKFYAAQQVIPLVALGLCFHAFYFFFSIGSMIKKKTWLVNLAYVPAAALNIAGNMILLPKYGYMAAAWVTVCTYFVFSVILFFACRGLVKISYEYKRIGVLFLAGVGVGGAVAMVQCHALWEDIVKGVVAILAFLSLLWGTRWFTAGELQVVKEKMISFGKWMGIR